MFDWLMEANKNTARDKMLGWFGKHRDLEALTKLSDEDLRAEYCQGLTEAMWMKGQDAKPEKKEEGKG